MDFTNKVVIVTGASSGIGAAAATLFAAYGALLTLVGRNENRLQKVASECKASRGNDHLCMALDLTQRGSCEAVIEKTVQIYGKVDVLVNSASKVTISSLHDPIDVFDELMAINFRVPYKMTQLALPHLMKTKGNVVNVASSMTRRWKRGFLPYALSKNALERFSKLGAAELCCDGVRMNAVSPGITKANLLANLSMSKSCSEYIHTTLKDAFPNDIVIKPDEVAILICLAASDLFPNMNGSNLTVDGASCMT